MKMEAGIPKSEPLNAHVRLVSQMENEIKAHREHIKTLTAMIEERDKIIARLIFKANVETS